MSQQRASACVAVTALLLAASLALPAFCADASAVDTSSFARIMAKVWNRDNIFERVKGAYVANDTLYVLGAPRGLAAIDPATGATRWLHVGRYPVDTQPTRLGDIVSFAEGGELVGVSEKLGAEVSRTKVRVGVLAPVYPTEENYWVVSAGDDRVYGVSEKDGRRLWHLTVNDTVTGSDWDPTFPELAVYMTRVGVLSGVGLKLRGFLWQTPFRKPACSPPTIVHPLVFVGCEDYFLYALMARSGVESWKVCLSAPVLDKPIVANGRVYVTTNDHVLHAVDIAQQQEVWALPDSGRVLTASPEWVVTQRMVEDAHLLTVINAATGKVAAQAASTRHDYLVADPDSGFFFAVNQTGSVLALGVRSLVEAQASAQATKASEKLSRAQAATTTTTAPAKPATTTVPGKPSSVTTTTAKPSGSGGGQKYFLVH